MTLEAVQPGFTIRWPDAVKVEAPEGQTAVRKFRAEDSDLVILHLDLPDVTGFEV
ncbi:MAG: hypothetical protein FJ314_00985 [SAR202 cluster bacterium]|nr:hypothetical protein [SAR202 cluster bacterium]